MFFSCFFKRQKPQKHRTLTEKVDHIEEVVVALENTLDKIHVDMWDKLTSLHSLEAFRPGIVLGLPGQDGRYSIAGFEQSLPDEDFAPFEPFAGEGEVES